MADHTDSKYEQAKAERQKYVDAVVRSSSRKKIVVAGPGTGKTHLFKQVLKGKTNTLTLTFVNALVEDLSLELYGMSDVRTLHSYARGVLSKAKNKDVEIFPKLSQVIREDVAILKGEDIDFDHIFHNREDSHPAIDFYKARKKYYDNYYGYSDIVFALVKYFEKDKTKVPAYEQVVVDEFQDFNKLEVSLIELLAEQSPMLLAGDDDQALYDFKSASAEYIRQRHSASNEEYESFGLPYCSRCTRVIVEAANDIIKAAITNGCLHERINKEYIYFDDVDKDKESDQNPHIVYTQQYAKQIPWFIEQQIGKIAEEVKKKFSVLIISPTKVMSRGVVKALEGKGFSNIAYTEKKDGKDPTLLDGLKLLIQDEKSNLGWRISLKFLLTKKAFKELIVESGNADAKPLRDIVDKDAKRELTAILKALRAVRKEEEVDEAVLAGVLAKLGMEPYGMEKEYLREEFANESQRVGNPGLRKIPIKATTVQSSKGLAEEYVFITHFDDAYFMKNHAAACDLDVCNFLVALTRARKKVFLISSRQTDPKLLTWIDPDRIERIAAITPSPRSRVQTATVPARTPALSPLQPTPEF